MRSTLVVLAILCSLPAAEIAHAATTQSTMTVTATVQNACILSSTDLAFGNYNPASVAPTDSTSTIEVTCTTGTNFTVGLNPGSTSGATVTTRQMANGASRLHYALYSDAGHSTNWGNTPGTDTPAATVATTTPSTFTVYGRVAAQQNVPAGNYADAVTISVNY